MLAKSRLIGVIGLGSKFEQRFGHSLVAAEMEVVAADSQNLAELYAVVVLSSLDGKLESLPPAGELEYQGQTILISDQPLAEDSFRPKVVLPEDVSPEILIFYLSGMVSPNRQLRQSERYLASMPVHYRCGPPDGIREGTPMTETEISNLSLGGAFVRTLNPPPVGSKVQLELEISGDYPPLALNGRVVYQVVADLERGVVYNPADPERQLTAHPGFAVVFDGSSFEARSILQRLLRKLESIKGGE
jgi:hypothetical protein